MLECIVNFSRNCYAIRFEHSKKKIHIYQFNFQANIDLLEIISPAQAEEQIIQIQFTDENNLLISIANKIESKLKFALFELNLDNTSDNSKVNQLWSYTINYFVDEVLYIKAVPFPNSNDKKTILTIYNYEYHRETFLLAIQDSNYTTQKYNFYNIKQTPFLKINEIIFCNNGLDLAFDNAT